MTTQDRLKLQRRAQRQAKAFMVRDDHGAARKARQLSQKAHYARGSRHGR